MPPEAGSPTDWLRHARSDLEVARLGDLEGVLPDTLCFHAQQAAEKGLKAVLQLRHVDFPRTHDIQVLINLLPADVELPHDVEAASSLTDYAVLARYPGPEEPVSSADYGEAVRLADAVVAWARGLIGRGTAP